MDLVSGVYAFRGVTYEEILVELKGRDPLQDRYALLFGTAWIYSGFVDDNITFFEIPTYNLTGRLQRGEQRSMVLVHRVRYGHYIIVTGG